jgi:hypothetical protein
MTDEDAAFCIKPRSNWGNVMSVDRQMEIVSADRLNKTHLVVDFSDGTTATFTVAQLTQIAPKREDATGFSDLSRNRLIQP